MRSPLAHVCFRAHVLAAVRLYVRARACVLPSGLICACVCVCVRLRVYVCVLASMRVNA